MYTPSEPVEEWELARAVESLLFDEGLDERLFESGR